MIVALDELSAPGPKCCLRVKDYGKAKIYFADQSLLPLPDDNSLRTLQDDITRLSETLQVEQEKEAQLKAESRQLSSEPSDELIDSEIAKLEKLTNEKSTHLNRLLELSSSSNGRVSADLARDRTVAIDTFNFYRNAWKTRKEKANDAIDMMLEGGLGKNKKETMVTLSFLLLSFLTFLLLFLLLLLLFHSRHLELMLMKTKESLCPNHSQLHNFNQSNNQPIKRTNE